MASNTVPEFYDYREINGHKFWDGGMLSNTPFRELLQAHQSYWKYVKKCDDKIPDLEVYIINLHPSKQPNPSTDHDGIKDRQNDITYFDRNSHYDEKITNLVTDYIDLINHLKCLALKHLDNDKDRSKFQQEFEDFLIRDAKSRGDYDEHRKYKDLTICRFELAKVLRIEHTNYINSVFGKITDHTERTITQLIKEGKADAWVALIKDDTMNSKFNCDDASTINYIRNNLVSKLDQIANHLKENDFENNGGAYNLLDEFINEIDRNKPIIDNTSIPGVSDKLKRSVGSFRACLEQM
jgi:hypothetical protein